MQLVGQRQGVVYQDKEDIDEACQIPEWEQCVWLCAQREPLYAFCGLEARSCVSGKNLGKMGTMVKMVTQHGKAERSDTKLGTVSMALLQREPLGYLGTEAKMRVHQGRWTMW